MKERQSTLKRRLGRRETSRPHRESRRGHETQDPLSGGTMSQAGMCRHLTLTFRETPLLCRSSTMLSLEMMPISSHFTDEVEGARAGEVNPLPSVRLSSVRTDSAL